MKKIDQKYEKLIEGALIIIKNEMDRLYFNKFQKEMDSPFENTGNVYANKVFKVSAYDWIEDNVYNFVYKDKFYVSWYKYLGRGMVIEVSDDTNFNLEFLTDMVNSCLKEMNKDKYFK